MRQVMLIFLTSFALCLYLVHGKAETVRAQMGPPITAAKQALTARDYAGALEQLDAADALPEHTPDEDQIITQMRVIAALGAKQADKAAAAVMRAINAKRLSDQDVQRYSLAIARGYYDAGTDPAALEWLKRYSDAGGDPAKARALLLRTTYRSGAWSEAFTIASSAMAEAEAHGARPDDDLVAIAADCAHRLGNTDAYLAMITKLAVATGKPAYWSVLIASVDHQPGFPDALILDLARLKLFVGVPMTAAQSIDAVERAAQAGYAGEAATLVEVSFTSGVLGTGADAARHERLRKLVATMLDEQRQKAGEEVIAARPDDRALVLAGLGLRKAAIALLEAAETDASLTEEARLHLGILYARDGRRDEAIRRFDGLAGSKPINQIAHLWSLAVQSKRQQ